MKKFLKVLSILGLSIFLCIVTLMTIFIAGYIYVEDDLPQLPKNLSHINYRPPTEIYSNDGELLKTIGPRNLIRLNMISREFQNAILAVEDRRFFNHSGIDPIAFLRAMFVNFKKGRLAQGGSTITQQLAKNLFFSFEKSWVRKFKELLIALQMESSFTKSAILEAYSNQIYFGNGAYGINEASLIYFGKNSSKLTLLQAAMLAGTVRSPNKFNPLNNREIAIKRAKAVLASMVREGFIDNLQKNNALNSELELKQIKKSYNNNQYFVDAVLEELNTIYGSEFVSSGGIRIFTTLNSKLQKRAEEDALHHLEFLDKKIVPREKKLQVAAVTIDNKNGAIRVMLGGKNYGRSQFNRALSTNRMIGSSFKPFVYLTAMQKLGFHPGTVLVDEPTVFKLPHNKKWEPANFNDEYMGPVVLKKAFSKSLNIISAKLIFKTTPNEVVKTARKFGFKSPLPKNFSLSLGATGASPFELAAAYSVIANLGTYKAPFYVSKIEDYQGNILYEHFVEEEKRFEPTDIYPLLDMMKGVMDNGSGRVIRRMGFKYPAGGKTGTTNNFRDAWFTGFTHDLTTSVWVGYDNNESMLRPNGKGVTGAHAAAPIWSLIMTEALDKGDKRGFPIPREIRFEYANNSDGFYEPKNTPNTVKVALKKNNALPRRPKIFPVRRTLNSRKVFFNKIRHSPRSVKDFKQTKTTKLKTNLDSKIWFMLNLENASMGKLKKIPTRWFVKMLKDTRDIETTSPERLIKGREVLIEKLLSRVGSFDHAIVEGVSIKSMLRPNEAEFYGNF